MGAIEDARNKLRMILPQPASKLAIRVVIGQNSSIKISAISVIEDLLDDYEFFISNASKAEKEEEEKRFLRAACLLLNAYIEGSVNSLYKIHRKRENIGKKKNKRKFHERCKELERAYLFDGKGSFLSDEIRKELRKLRNELIHFSKGDNFLIWNELSISNLEKQKQTFVSWLSILYKQKFENSLTILYNYQ
jgi:hypothetical protein